MAGFGRSLVAGALVAAVGGCAEGFGQNYGAPSAGYGPQAGSAAPAYGTPLPPGTVVQPGQVVYAAAPQQALPPCPLGIMGVLQVAPCQKQLIHPSEASMSMAKSYNGFMGAVNRYQASGNYSSYGY